jgi:hypothetical protein
MDRQYIEFDCDSDTYKVISCSKNAVCNYVYALDSAMFCGVCAMQT